jgi:tetratricopeptide (TPR) repeat protein
MRVFLLLITLILSKNRTVRGYSVSYVLPSLSTFRGNPRKETGVSGSDAASAEAILSKSQSNRDLIQDFVPLADSLEWQLGQLYLRERGNKAFISDASPVPFVINNDGILSKNAAEVFFASLAEAENVGPLEPEIYVLELGIGVGLFARYFLDSFRDLCVTHKRDYYDRLCYIAADKSPRMLFDVLRHGVLANHPGRYRLRQVDAMEPEKLLNDIMFSGAGRVKAPTRLRAVFLNYLLDCLPAAVLQLEGEVVKQLCVRTCVGRNVKLEDHTDMRVEALQARAKSQDPKSRQELLEVFGLFASEYDYRPVDVETLPHGRFVSEYGRKLSKRVLHSYGAIQALQKLLDMVHNQGFILINDYGQTQATRDEEIEHQRFSLATFVGVNFPLLKAFFTKEKRSFVEPPGEERSIHSRLLGRKLGAETQTRFLERFGAATQDRLQEPINQARACAKAGRFELAATHYYEALSRQSRNWVLLNEISVFLIFSMRDARAGIDMVKLALALNPACSADLWNTLGDGLYESGRAAEARSAYQKALEVNSTDLRSRYNLAWVYTREGNYVAALAKLAEALSLDKTGEYRDRVLQKQQEVLAQLTQRNRQEYLLLVNLVSRFAKRKDKDDEPARPEEVPVKS